MTFLAVQVCCCDRKQLNNATIQNHEQLASTTGSASLSIFGCVHSSAKEAGAGAQFKVFAGDRRAMIRILLAVHAQEEEQFCTAVALTSYQRLYFEDLSGGKEFHADQSACLFATNKLQNFQKIQNLQIGDFFKIQTSRSRCRCAAHLPPPGDCS